MLLTRSRTFVANSSVSRRLALSSKVLSLSMRSELSRSSMVYLIQLEAFQSPVPKGISIPAATVPTCQ